VKDSSWVIVLFLAVLAAAAGAGVWVQLRRWRYLAPGPETPPDDAQCAHCGSRRPPEDLIRDRDALLCRPRMAGGPACYELVTAFGETVGDRLPGRALRKAPMPWDAGYEVYRDTAAIGVTAGVEVLPAVFGVLADHCAVTTPSGRVYCTSSKGVSHASFDDQPAWRRHVGPLLATALTPPDSPAVVGRPSMVSRVPESESTS
jgi:hypothetical protein